VALNDFEKEALRPQPAFLTDISPERFKNVGTSALPRLDWKFHHAALLPSRPSAFLNRMGRLSNHGQMCRGRMGNDLVSLSSFSGGNQIFGI
jgi:hypothetical protein